MNVKLLLSFFLCILFLTSCIDSKEQLLLPQMTEEEQAILEEIRKQKVRGIVYHHASLKDDDLVVILSYPSWSKKQIELLGSAVLQNAQVIFTANENIEQFTFYMANGSNNPEHKHFITVTRNIWENPSVTLTSGPIMAYETAKTYFVGPRVSGKLSFVNGAKEFINLPPQKPMP